MKVYLLFDKDGVYWHIFSSEQKAKNFIEDYKYDNGFYILMQEVEID